MFDILFTKEIFKHNCLVNTQLHTRLNEFLLTGDCFVLPFHYPTRSVKWTFLKQKVRFIENSIAIVCICAFTYLSVPFYMHFCCYWFTWFTCLMYLLVYFFFMLLVVCLLMFILCWCCWRFTCNKLVIVVAIAVIYCF